VYEGGKVEGLNVTFKDLIGDNIEEVKKFRNDKRGHLDKLNAFKEQ